MVARSRTCLELTIGNVTCSARTLGSSRVREIGPRRSRYAARFRRGAATEKWNGLAGSRQLGGQPYLGRTLAASAVQIVAIMPFLIPIVGILAWAYLRAETIKAESGSLTSDLMNELDGELAEAEAERERLRKRIETLEAIVTGEGFDLDREARKAGLDLDALGEAPSTERASSTRNRTR